MNDLHGQQPIGGETRRVDAYDKVTGQTKYVEDISMPGLLHARVLRSPYHHAHLISLDTSAAIRVPGVIRIITAEDIPGVNGFPEYSHDEPLLTPVGDTLKTKGAPIAFVVADTLDAAQAGLDAVRVAYEPLPYFFDSGQGDIALYQSGNQLKEHQVVQGDTEVAFS
jgi:CO/xanthine dehydrogenase Mo-binding subunit